MPDFPDIPAGDPSQEEADANKRALTLGLIAGGLGILAQPHFKGQPAVQPIARGALEGLQAGLGSLSGSQQQQYQRRQQQIELAKASAEANMRGRGLDIEQQRATDYGRQVNALEGLRDQQANDIKPIGKDAGDPFASWRNDPRLKDALPSVEDSANLSPKDIREFRNEIGKSILSGGETKVNFEDAGDGFKHMLVTDKSGNLIKDSKVLPSKPTGAATTTDKTKDEDWTDPDTGYTWNVTRDINTGKAIGIGPKKSAAPDAYSHYFKGPTLPPDVSKVPDWTPLERKKYQAGATAQPAGHGISVGDAAKKSNGKVMADGEYPIGSDMITVKGGKVTAVIPNAAMTRDSKGPTMLPPPPSTLASSSAAPAPAASAPAAPAAPAAAPMPPAAPKPPVAPPAVAPRPAAPPVATKAAPLKVTPYVDEKTGKQLYNPKTGQFVYRDAKGNYYAAKSASGPFIPLTPRT
jgi:hypothetical protein